MRFFIGLYLICLNVSIYANENIYFSKGIIKGNGLVLTKIESNNCYIFNNGKVNSVLLAGPKDRSYFYFPCGAIIFSKKVSVNNSDYYIVNVSVRTSPQESSEFVRVVKEQDNDLIDENKLSYNINSCFSLEGGYSLLDISYLSYLISNKDKLDKICDENLGQIVVGKKTNLYNFSHKKNYKKGYLIKGDKVTASKYMAVNGEFWLYVSFGEEVKRWMKMNDIF